MSGFNGLPLHNGAKVLEDMKAKAAGVEGWTIVEPNYEGLRVSCGF